MAGTVVLTEETHGTIKKVKFAWTSGKNGDAGKADKTTEEAYSGKILGLCTVPDAVAVPTADYDVRVLDEDGIDVLMGAGADRSDTVTQYVLSTSLGAVAYDTLTLEVRNAGAEKKGIVYLFIR